MSAEPTDGLHRENKVSFVPLQLLELSTTAHVGQDFTWGKEQVAILWPDCICMHYIGMRDNSAGFSF